uniref:DDE Tnp4 domain-containing protein n=1 Tax=Solanum lycopersicum TaxID=4081 RepID=A0A3Q7JS08_SOLLC|nr:protein ALP1-like [Solanum lycopersicum]
MEITSFSSSFPSQEDFNSLNFFQELDFLSPSSDHHHHQSMSKKIKINDFDHNPVEEILNKFLGVENETHPESKSVENHTLFDYKNQKFDFDHGVVSGTKRVRENANENEDGLVEVISGSGSGSGYSQQPLQQRRLWVKNRSNAWWEQCNRPDFPEEEFKKAFHMGKATFDFICSEIESVVTKKDTMLRMAIPVRQRVAVCIWRLATGEPLREVSRRFGLGISTCHKLVLEVCTAIRGVLMAKFIQWPDELKMEEIKHEFEILSGIENVGGSMYTTHVPIIAPKESVASYFNKRHTERNQKTSYSVTVQGVVDPKGIFTDVCIGWPGSMTDDQVLEKSILYERANRGNLNGTYIVGSSGFPLTDWILVPFTHQNVTWTQHAFNEKVNDVQRVAKEAFMRLKARWSCLKKRTEVKLQDLPVVLGACCTLHNICEIRGEELRQELRFDLVDDEMIPEVVVRSMNAMKVRDQIAHKLLHHNHSGTSFL